MAALKLAKQALRKEVKAKIAALTDAEKLRQSECVTQMLLQSDIWKKSSSISIFMSMNDEIQTHKILSEAFAANKHCFIPRYVGSRMDMLRLHSWQDFESLPVTSWNIKQPSEVDDGRENAAETGCLDLILVPGLAFTHLGHRLGRGKGYYDKFLTEYKQKFGNKYPLTVALAFREQLLESIPTSEYDVIVNMVLFEQILF